MDQIQVEGFIPVIIQVAPINDLPFLLGFENEDDVQQIASVKKET